MIVAYPATPPLPGPSRQSFELERIDYQSGDARGRIGGVTAGFPLWRLEWTLGRLTARMTDEWRAFVAGQRGSQRWFYAYDLYRPHPRFYEAGKPYAPVAASWSHAVDSAGVARLTLTGLNAGQVVATGDYAGFEWDIWKRAAVRSLETIIASASGVAVFAIEPAVPAVVPVGAVANLKRPTCLMKLLPDTKLASPNRMGQLESGTIAAIQDLVA